MDLQAIIEGTTYDVTGENLYLVEHDGLGDFDVTRLTERGAQQHGDTDRGWRGEARLFTLAFQPAYNPSDRYDERARLRRLFSPQNDLTLKFWLPNGDRRAIDCKRLRAPLPVRGSGAAGERLVYRFRSANPFLTDPDQQTATWSLSIVNSLVLPYSLPYFFAESVINDTENVTYAGDVDEHPIVTLTGPMLNPIVSNEETDEHLKLERTINAGEQVVIDTRYGHKSVTLTGGVRLTLTDDSDLGTFHLAAAIDGTASRTNTLRVYAAGATAGQTQVSVTWYNRYGGI